MENKNNTQYFTAPGWRIALWPLIGGVNNMFVILMVFTSYVAAGGYGIAVAVAGLIATASRIFDAITDPVIAIIADKFSSRFGKVRILLGIGFLIMILSVSVMFFWGINPERSTGLNLLIYTAAYMVYITGYTIFGIAQNIGNPIMTNEPKQRMSQARWKTIHTQVFAVAVTFYMSKILAAKYGGINIGAFQELALMCIIVGTILVIISMIAISPYDKMEKFSSGKSEPVKVKDVFSILKGNKPLWAFIAAASSDKLALQAASQSAITTMVFGIIIGNYSFNGNLSAITLIPTIFIIFYATKLRGKNDTKSTTIKWSAIAIILAVVMILFMLAIDPKQISVSPLITGAFLVLYCLFTGAKIVTSVCNNAMIPDLIDYEMYRSGNYLPGTVAAIYSFIDKMISSLATTVVSFCIAAVGYTTSMPQPSDQSTPAIFGVAMFLWMGMPIIGWLITIISMKFYSLDGDMMKKVQQANNEKRKAATSA